MNKITICGHFSFNKELLNGQTIKTKIIAKALSNEYGEERINYIDTHGGLKKMPYILCSLGLSMIKGNDIVILPGLNGLQVIVPFIFYFRNLFESKVYYVVIGGWLPSFITPKKHLCKQLKCLNGIFVETHCMKNALDTMGFENVSILPNCKQLRIVNYEYDKSQQTSIKLCTFSRVMKEKGIEDAVNAVILLNKKSIDTYYTLDIYGQIEPTQQKWFEDLMESSPDYICYRGLIEYDKSSDVLKDYYLLLFPTYYEGEGFAGTMIDAMAAGTPIIASNWKYNAEIIDENQIGCLVEPHNIKDLAERIDTLGKDVKQYCYYRNNCLSKASKYLPENAIKVLTTAINNDS